MSPHRSNRHIDQAPRREEVLLYLEAINQKARSFKYYQSHPQSQQQLRSPLNHPLVSRRSLAWKCLAGHFGVCPVERPCDSFHWWCYPVFADFPSSWESIRYIETKRHRTYWILSRTSPSTSHRQIARGISSRWKVLRTTWPSPFTSLLAATLLSFPSQTVFFCLAPVLTQHRSSHASHDVDMQNI